MTSPSKQRYHKKYFQREEVKDRNADRMKDTYYTEEGQAYEHKKRRTPRSRYMRGMYQAKRRKKEFTLTFEEYVELISHPCYYCNKDISDETGVGLDRMDNNLGYITGNVTACCGKCNRKKFVTFGGEEFKKQSKINRGENE